MHSRILNMSCYAFTIDIFIHIYLYTYIHIHIYLMNIHSYVYIYIHTFYASSWDSAFSKSSLKASLKVFPEIEEVK